MGDDIATGQQIGDLVQIRRVVADMHHQRQLAVSRWISLANTSGRVPFLPTTLLLMRLDADDKTGMVGDGPAGLVRFDVRQLRQLVLPQQADARMLRKAKTLVLALRVS